MAELPAERLAQIESHVAHLERLGDELNTVVSGQTRELERLKRQVARLAESLEGMESERIKATNPKPPHYQ
jgi:SlyX protein